MLHILLLILKIIGIILAVILGILVLLICIVLFMPVCYQGSAKCDGSIDSLHAAIRVTWLFKLIQVNVRYENGKAKYSVRIAWKKVIGGKNHEKTKEDVKKCEENETVDECAEKDTEKESVISERLEEKIEEVSEEVKTEIKDELETVSSENKESEKTVKRSGPTVKETVSDNKEAVSDDKDQTPFTKKIKQKIANITKKLFGIKDKIKCTLKSICAKIKSLLEKKDKVMSFIEDETHRKAFWKIKKELFKFLKRLKPKKLMVKARFGFDDPSLTGNVLAGLAVVYPFIGEHVEIDPDFEQQVLMGKMMVKGRIYIIHLACMAWNLLWCKQVRQSYKDVRNFKL